MSIAATAHASTAQARQCWHCGEPIPARIDLQVEYQGRAQPVCCAGCEAAANWILSGGLGDFYRLRSESSGSPAGESDFSAWDREALQRQYVHTDAQGRCEVNLVADGIRCAACTWLIQNALARAGGVLTVEANPVSRRIWLRWDPARQKLGSLLALLARLGFSARPLDHQAAQDHARRERRAALKRLVVAGLGMMQAMMYSVALYAGAFADMNDATRDFFRWISFLVAAPVIAYAGQPFLLGAVREIRARSLGMDTPVALALSLAFAASLFETLRGGEEVYFDSVTMFVFLLSLGRHVELVVRQRAVQRADAIARTLPAVATREIPSGTEQVGVEELSCGDVLRVAAGETVPVDGMLCDDSAELDESLLSGESRPQRRRNGDPVLAGSLARNHTVRMRVQATGTATVIAGMLRLIERAQRERPRLAQMAERIASWFVLRVLLVTALTALVWMWFDPDRAFAIALSVLVVSCPCALSLAIPTALAAATSALAQRGVLVVRADALERLASIDTVVFDKTGTLTTPDIRIAEVETFAGTTREQALALAAALEAQSRHPLARAFADLAIAEGVGQVHVEAGAGIRAQWKEGELRLGRRGYADVQTAAAGDDGDLWLSHAGQLLARFSLDTQLRPEAAEVCRALEQRGLTLELLSGDAGEAVEQAARALDIAHYSARCTPAHKLERVRELQAQGRRVLVVGDGINDAAVLAGADVSIALAEGSALAQSSADLVLARADLRAIPEALVLAQSATRRVRQNFAWALGYNLCVLPFAMLGWVTPWLAAIGMSVSSIVVTLNATRAHARTGKDTA